MYPLKDSIDLTAKFIEVIGHASEFFMLPWQIKKVGKIQIDLIDKTYQQQKKILLDMKENPDIFTYENMDKLNMMLGKHTNFEKNNIKETILNSFEYIKEEKSTNSELPSDDWLYDFFDKVKGISDKEVQLIWSKILASEIATPNSISLVTLNSLKTIDKNFAHILEIALSLSDQGNLFFGLDAKLSFLSLIDIVNLIDRGFLSSSTLTFQNHHENYIVVSFVGHKYHYQILDNSKGSFMIKTLKTTQQFDELQRVLNIQVKDSYVEEMINLWKSNKYDVTKLIHLGGEDYRIIGKL
jgi:hypothetical protein